MEGLSLLSVDGNRRPRKARTAIFRGVLVGWEG